MPPRDLESVRGQGPVLATIPRFFDATVSIDAIGRAQDEMIRVLRIHPYRPAVAVVVELPGFAAILRAVKPATCRRIDKVGRGGMDFQGVDIRVDKWFRRTFEIRLAITAFDKRPGFSFVIRDQNAADLDRRIDPCAMKGKAAYTTCLW